jgi:hypothetical protein
MSEQGYYSLIQYSEHPERIEFVNVGVVLFSDAAPRVLVKFSENPRRVERVFGVNLGQHFRLLKESIESRIYGDFHKSWDRQSIDRFISLRSGKLRLSPPRAVHVIDARKVVDDLFERLVGEPEQKEREPRVSSKLKRRLSYIGVEGLLEKPKPIHLPQGVVIKAPYAYQNGSYNLIKAISLRQSPEQALQAAGKHAIEGRWLHEATQSSKPSKLIVVGDTEGQQDNFTRAVSEVMRDHNVSFFSMEKLEPLAHEIQRAASSH